jgi:hypothetical protein
LYDQFLYDKNLVEFFKAIDAQRSAYTPYFNYIALRNGADYIICQASVGLGTDPMNVPASQFTSDNLRAGHYNLSDLKVSIEDMLSCFLAGSIDTPQGKLLFPSLNGECQTSFDPFHQAGIANQSRLNVLRISGRAQLLDSQSQELNWELRASSYPYDNVQELMNEYKLGILRTDNISVEFIAFNVAVVEFASRVEGTRAFPRIRLANGLDTSLATLGYRVMMRGNVLSRGILTGDKLTWQNGGSFNTGQGELEIPSNAALQCFANYAGATQHFGWLADPMALQNPRRAVYEAFDSELKVLKDILAKAQGRGPQAKELEAALAWLLWMLGFSVAHFGGTPRTKDAADLVVVAPNGSFAIVECTTGLLKAENKMALLNDRVQAARLKLNSSENSHIRILPVMITSKSREEVRPDLEQAERLGILVLTKEDFEPALQRTFFFPDADQVINEGLQAAELAHRKYLSQ